VASLFGLSKLWPFRTPSGTKAEASHQLTVTLRTEGVQYAAVPLLSEWTEKWDFFGTDSATVALLAQMEEMGHVEQLDGGIWLGWEALYQLLNTEDGEPSELLALLKLPDLTDFRPSLSSQGSLEDLDFRITLGEWVNASGEKLAPPPEIMGAVVKIADCQWLLAEPVWRLVREVRQFYTKPIETRSALGNRRTWGAIRRYAQAADAPAILIMAPLPSFRHGCRNPAPWTVTCRLRKCLKKAWWRPLVSHPCDWIPASMPE